MEDNCKNCPFRLYNKKGHRLNGVGNPFSTACIVVPNVDYVAYKHSAMEYSKQVDIIRNILLSSTGSVEPNLYIIPLIRCNESISCEINDDIYNKCLSYFKEDLIRYDWRYILLLGNAVSRFLNCNISEYLDTAFITDNHRCYNVNYSPMTYYTNTKNFEIFKQNLIKWYNSVITDNLLTYKIMKV